MLLNHSRYILDLENRRPTRDCSQNDPYPEVEFSIRRTSNSANWDQEETSHNELINAPYKFFMQVQLRLRNFTLPRIFIES